MTTHTTSQSLTIDADHLRGVLNIDGVLAVIATEAGPRVVALGRRTQPGERLLATADRVEDFVRRLGGCGPAARALTLALAGTASGPLL